MSKLQPRLTGRPLLFVIWIPIIPMPTTGPASACPRTVRNEYTSRPAPPPSKTRIAREIEIVGVLSIRMLFVERCNAPAKAPPVPQSPGPASVSSPLGLAALGLAALRPEDKPDLAWAKKACDQCLFESDHSFRADRGPTASSPSGCPMFVPIGISRSVALLRTE